MTQIARAKSIGSFWNVERRDFRGKLGGRKLRSRPTHNPEKLHLPGSDETFTAALGFGIDSAVGSTYNFMPQVVILLKWRQIAFSGLFEYLQVFQRLQELHSKGDIKEVMCENKTRLR